MASLTLYLVRHGETLWNAEGRFQGHRDVPLSETGREQARRLAVRLQAVWNTAGNTGRDNSDAAAAQPHAGVSVAALPGPRPWVVFSSDLERAAETAAILRDGLNLSGAEPPLPPVYRTPLLRERGFGTWEGLTRAEIRDRWPGATEPENSEDWQEAFARIAAARELIEQEVSEAGFGEAAALIVGHGGTLRMLLGLALGGDMEMSRRFLFDNTSLSVIKFTADALPTGEGGSAGNRQKGRILLVNDTAHLLRPG